jgi:hypothetical protein
MLRLLFVCVAVFPLAQGFAVAQLSAADDADIVLFNGKNFDGWTAVISRPGIQLEDIWSVKEGGILVCQGRDKPTGYLRHHRDDFENYTLTLQWRFPEGTPGGNSGVLVHTTTPGEPRPADKNKSKEVSPLFVYFWPKCFEAQLNHTHAGDIWVINTTCQIENPDKRVTGRRHFNLTDGSEKPIGQWNDYKIQCQGDEITIWVNGDLVNHITKCSQSKGAICLQAEGADIEFREIRLKPLKN